MTDSPTENRRSFARQLALKIWLDGGDQNSELRSACIKKHPDLAADLTEEFRRLRLIDAAQVAPRETVDLPGNTANVTPIDTLAIDQAKDQVKVKADRCFSCGAILSGLSGQASTKRDGAQCPLCGAAIAESAIPIHHRPGDRLGDYELTRPLGNGSFGTVWLAHDHKLLRQVALKIPRRGLMSRSDEEAFILEARVAAAVNHPQVVAVHDVGVLDEITFICTEYVPGSTLGEWSPPPEDRALAVGRMIRLICEPIQAIHDAGIVHRDLKPSNVLVTPGGIPKVTDFGVAKSFHQSNMTLTGQVLGTPSYMSPEVAGGSSKDSDSRTDIFSLGVILYEFLAARLPFQGEATMKLLQQICEVDPPPIHSLELPWDVPVELSRICMKCLEKDPRDRYQTARELADDLARFEQGEPVHARPKPLALSLYRYAEKKPTLAMTLGFLLVGFITFPLWAATIFWGDKDLPRRVPQIVLPPSPTEQSVEQADMDTRFSEAVSVSQQQPRVGLEMLFALTHELLDGTTAIGDEYRQRKLRESRRLMVENAASLKSKRLSHELGQPEKLWTPNQAGLVVQCATDGNRVNNQTSFRNRTLVAWVEEESRVLHRKSIETILNTQGVCATPAGHLTFPQKGVAIEGREGVFTWSAYPSEFGKFRKDDWKWNDLPASFCKVATDQRLIWTVQESGDLRCTRINGPPGRVSPRTVTFSPAIDGVVSNLHWFGDADLLITETATGVQAWDLDVTQAELVANQVTEWVGSFVEVSGSQNQFAIQQGLAAELQWFSTQDVQSLGGGGVPLPSDETLEMVASSDGESIFVLSRMGDEWVWRAWKPKLESVLNLISWQDPARPVRLFPHPSDGRAILVGREILTWNPERETLTSVHGPIGSTESYGPVVWLPLHNEILYSIDNRVFRIDLNRGSTVPIENRSNASSLPIDVHQAAVEFFAVSPDERWFASCDSEGTVHQSQISVTSVLQNLDIIRPAGSQSTRLIKEVVSPDEDKIVLEGEDGRLELYRNNRFLSGQPVWRLSSRKLDGVRSSAIGDKFLAILTEDDDCRVYSSVSDKSPTRFEMQVSKDRMHVEFSPDQRWLLIWGDEGLDCIDLKTRTHSNQRFSYPNKVRDACWAFGRNQVVVLDENGEMLLLEPQLNKVIARNDDRILSNNGQDAKLVSCRDFTFAVNADSVAWLSQVQAAPQVGLNPIEPLSIPLLSSSIAFRDLRHDLVPITSQGSETLTLYLDRRRSPEIRQFNTERWTRWPLRGGVQGSDRARDDLEASGTQVFAVSPNEKKVFQGVEGNLRIWSIENREISLQASPIESTRLTLERRDRVTAAQFDHVSTRLALGFGSGRIVIWDADQKGEFQLAASLAVSDRPIEKLRFSDSHQSLFFQAQDRVGQVRMETLGLMKQLAFLTGAALPSETKETP